MICPPRTTSVTTSTVGGVTCMHSSTPLLQSAQPLSLHLATHHTVTSFSNPSACHHARVPRLPIVTLPEAIDSLFQKPHSFHTILIHGPPRVGRAQIPTTIAAFKHAQLFQVTAYDVFKAIEDNCEVGVSKLFASTHTLSAVVLVFRDIEFVFPADNAADSERLKRGKTHFLKELRALRTSVENVTFVALAQKPWLLDNAFVDEMHQQIYVRPPDPACRIEILKTFLQHISHELTDEQIDNIAIECESFSIADIYALVKNTEMEAWQEVQRASYFRQICVAEDGNSVYKMTPCDPDDEGAARTSYWSVSSREILVPPVTCLDFEIALDRTKPSVAPGIDAKHLEFFHRMETEKR